MCCSPRLSTGMQPSTSLTQLLSGAGRLCRRRSAPLVRSRAMSASCTEPFFIFCSGPPSVRLTITMVGSAVAGSLPSGPWTRASDHSSELQTIPWQTDHTLSNRIEWTHTTREPAECSMDSPPSVFIVVTDSCVRLP
eukprot:5913491-Prymnesium_polylepis.1